MAESAPAPVPRSPSPIARARPKGVRGFLMGPQLVDRKGFWFVLAIFIMVAVVFAVALYGFLTTLQPIPSAPVEFAPAYMRGGNGTFNVTSVDNASWPWTGFMVNLTINDFGAQAVPLAPGGHNATFLIGSTTQKNHFHVVWNDTDHDGKVSVGDVFWVTGNGVPLPALSYIKVSLIWGSGVWTATEYFVTSSAIV